MKFSHIPAALFFLLLSACSKDVKLFEIQNLNDNKIWALGHGGMGLSQFSPIDSYESLAKGMALRPDGIEVDVQMTKDHVLVAFHDEFLDDATNGSGKINDHNWVEIKNLHYDENPFASYSFVSCVYNLQIAKNQTIIFMRVCVKNFSWMFH